MYSRWKASQGNTVTNNRCVQEPGPRKLDPQQLELCQVQLFIGLSEHALRRDWALSKYLERS